MQKNSWKIKSKHSNSFLDLVSLHKDKNGVITSAGLCISDNKPIGSVTVTSKDFWSKPRKIQIPRKTIMYALAHSLALTLYTNNKIGLADEKVAEWLGADERGIRDSRKHRINKHFSKIGSLSPVYLCFDGKNGDQISLFLLDANDSDKYDKLPFKYSGRIYLWHKGDKDITVISGDVIVG